MAASCNLTIGSVISKICAHRLVISHSRKWPKYWAKSTWGQLLYDDMMGSGLPPRPLLSGCPPQCMQSLLPRRNAYPQLRHFHHQSVQTNLLQRAAAVTAAPHAGQQQQQQPTILHIYPLPRTKVYEHTRPQPRAPVRHRLLPGRAAAEFKVNDDQRVLDDMYTKLFGRGQQGAELLVPELRWQAVTHISFDHGRQPYNNKLAFLGKVAESLPYLWQRMNRLAVYFFFKQEG